MVWARHAHGILGGNFRPVFQVLLEHQMGSGTEEEGENHEPSLSQLLSGELQMSPKRAALGNIMYKQ